MKKFLTCIVSWLVHQSTSFFGHAAGVVIFMALYTGVKAFKDDHRLEFYLNNPAELVSPAVVAVLTMLVIGLSTLVTKQRKSLLNFGVRLFSKHDSEDAKRDDWALLCSDVKRASSEKTTLWILGATGRETFAGTSSPLHDVVKKYEGEIRVLLIRPGSEAFKKRCGGLGMAESKYLDQILDSIDFCKDLASQQLNSVQLRLYEGIPIWKMIMTNRVLWVQFYKPSTHFDNTPMYCFEFRDDGSTLFDGFRTVFTKRWDHDGSKHVDLASFVRSDWQTTC